MNKTILIVDDDSFIRLLLRRLLTSQGYTVVEAAGGEAAMELLEQESPDLVISDLNMPGMNGIELTRALRTNPRHVFVPLIMSSASVDTATRRTARQAGVNFWLEKPLEPERLFELTRWALTVGQELAEVAATVEHRAANW